MRSTTLTFSRKFPSRRPAKFGNWFESSTSSQPEQFTRDLLGNIFHKLIPKELGTRSPRSTRTSPRRDSWPSSPSRRRPTKSRTSLADRALS